MYHRRYCLTFAIAGSLLSVAQSYAPIQWTQAHQKGLILKPRGYPTNLRSLVPPQKLVVGTETSIVPRSMAPYFSAKLDQTITWDDMGWCIEAEGRKRGDAVRVNRCTGEPQQKWNWVPDGLGGNMIQLQDTTMCLDVVDQAVELHDCEKIVSESWSFEDQHFALSQAPALSSELRRIIISLLAVFGIGGLSFGAWFLRKPRARAFAVCQGGIVPQDDGVCLTVPIVKQQEQNILSAQLLTTPAPTFAPRSANGRRSTSPQMRRVCDLTGKKANRKARTITFSHHRNHKIQFVNLQKKKFWWPEGKAWVRVKIATSTLRTIRKNGIDKVAKKNGVDLNKFKFSGLGPSHYIKANWKIPEEKVKEEIDWEAMGYIGGVEAPLEDPDEEYSDEEDSGEAWE